MSITSIRSGEEIVALTKTHTLYEWSAQSKVDPIPVAGAEGCWFWTPEGKRYLDFNSQLMCVNIGHSHPRVVKAIQEQAAILAYANPFMATETRALLGEKLARITPGDIDAFFFTNGGAEANENAIKIARMYTGRHKILARYRSYHGATGGAMTLTGDPRRWAAEPGLPGIVHVADAWHGVQRGWDEVGLALANIEEVIQFEGPQHIAAFFVEAVTGTNGILVPPDGYLEGIRDLCTKYGILMVADEVMSGFGRTGAWFAVDHWKIVPDLMTMAKGLTSAYVPLGAVGMRRAIADHFKNNVFYGGLTYNSHPLACAAALATLAVYEDEDLIARARRTGEVMKGLLKDLEARHDIVGATRSIGLFGIVELVKSKKTLEPLAPYNSTSEPMTRLGRFFREQGLYTFVRWNGFFTNPPLTISDDELRHGFDIIDRGLRELR
ncbi:MAG TPA: aminotransferase class III-fold pyridoxal phosphate-dependent enzyme [Vicinamibacterales bacterium]|nr:aminotransferase class III-fold pyridoxal phosphate-dependent enzyme [Vicinamibacterales bacterium]